MIDRSKEKTFPLAELAKRVDQRKTYQTVRNWANRGLVNRHTRKRVYLEVCRGPNGDETSVEAYYRMLRALDGTPP